MSPSNDSSVAPETPPQIRVFFCYAREDDELRRELLGHLSILRHSEIISAWYDGEITAGSEWEKEISSHLASADVVILLISPSFLSSDYCYNIEMKHALERHEAGEARVIPVILRPVDWEGAPFGKLQMLPRDAKPVTKWPERDEALLSVAQGIRTATTELLALREISRDESAGRIYRRHLQLRQQSRSGPAPDSGLTAAVQQKKIEYLEQAYQELEAAHSTLQAEVAAEREERPALLEQLEGLRESMTRRELEYKEILEKLVTKHDEQQAELARKTSDYNRLRLEAQEMIDKLMERIKELNSRLTAASEPRGFKLFR